MDLRQVECFVAVAERLNFGRAATHLGLAQSALSRQVQLLEAELGVRLLDRNKRAPMRLTDAGARFLPEAQAAIARFARAASVARQAGRGEIGRLEIGYVASATYSGVLPATLSAFRRDCPEVTVGLAEMETARQLVDLVDGRIDVGFLRPRPDYPSGVTILPLLDEPVVMALPADHALARGDAPIHAARLAGESFIVPQADDRVGFSAHTAAIGRAGGFAAAIDHYVRDFITVLNLVAVGAGVAAVPASLQRLRLPDVAYRPLADVVIHAEIVAAARSGANAPVTGRFLDVLRRRGRTVFALDAP